jgi:hypothetical protein
VTKRRLAAVPDPPPHPHDVCGDCGHLYSHHLDGKVCLAYRPARPLKSVDYRTDPIEQVTQVAVQSGAKPHAKDFSSSVCACRTFVPSGSRFVPEADPTLRQLVINGKRRRTVLPIAELSA